MNLCQFYKNTLSGLHSVLLGVGGVWVKIESDYKIDKSYDFLKRKHWLWSRWEKTKPWHLWRENLRPQELWGREQYYFCLSESPLKVNSWRKRPDEVIPSCCKQFKCAVRLSKLWVAHLWLWRTNCKGLKFVDFVIEGCSGISLSWILRDNFNGLLGFPALPEGSDTIWPSFSFKLSSLHLPSLLSIGNYTSWLAQYLHFQQEIVIKTPIFHTFIAVAITQSFCKVYKCQLMVIQTNITGWTYYPQIIPNKIKTGFKFKLNLESKGVPSSQETNLEAMSTFAFLPRKVPFEVSNNFK